MNVKHVRKHRDTRSTMRMSNIHNWSSRRRWETMDRSNIWWNNSWRSSKNHEKNFINHSLYRKQTEHYKCNNSSRIYLQWCVFGRWVWKIHKESFRDMIQYTSFAPEHSPSWPVTEAGTITALFCYLILSCRSLSYIKNTDHG